MNNTVLLHEALLCGLLAYLAAQGTPWFLGSQTGSFYLLSRPLIAGLIVGIIMKDLYRGILIGAAVQTVFLSSVGVGGSISADLPFASYIGIPIAMKTTGTGIAEAIALSSTVAILGIFIHNAMSSLNIFWMHQGQRKLEQNKFKQFFIYTFIYSTFTTFLLRFTPAFLAVWFGASEVNRLIEALPQKAIHSLEVLGGLLPALGIAILLRQTVKKNIMFVYFLTGFMFIYILQGNMISLAILGSLFAYFHYSYAKEGSSNNTKDEHEHPGEEELL